MSVYVGIDVHRKRSQVAVVTEDGQVQLNKNTVNGTEPILRQCKAIASARLKNDKGRRRHIGPAPARVPAPGGVDRPAGGAAAARAQTELFIAVNTAAAPSTEVPVWISILAGTGQAREYGP
jgi:hypothetical protein